MNSRKVFELFVRKLFIAARSYLSAWFGAWIWICSTFHSGLMCSKFVLIMYNVLSVGNVSFNSNVFSKLPLYLCILTVVVAGNTIDCNTSTTSSLKLSKMIVGTLFAILLKIAPAFSENSPWTMSSLPTSICLLLSRYSLSLKLFVAARLFGVFPSQWHPFALRDNFSTEVYFANGSSANTTTYKAKTN